MPRRFWLETLGCPKNQVDSDKLAGTLLAGGLVPADSPEGADLVVVNTCAFVEEARQESIDTILTLSDQTSDEAELVVTGCLAERYGDELAEALPEVDAVRGFGQPVTLQPVAVPVRPADVAPGTGTAVQLGPPRLRSAEELAARERRPGSDAAGVAEAAVGAGSGPTGRQPTAISPVAGGAPGDLSAFDLLNLPRPPSATPWAYVKVAEGCDRACGFCAIPSFRGPQRSRTLASILGEVDELRSGGVREIVLVAQDLAAYGRDQGRGERRIGPLVEAVAQRVDRVRLLYLYPSDLTDALVGAICASGVPYFDLSLQHVSRPLLRRMRRWGDGERFLRRIEAIRQQVPEATFRSNFIVGYPGETEDDHDQLLAFVEAAQLDWVGFFPFSREEGTYAADLDGQVDRGLMRERLAELSELQDGITAARRDALIGSVAEVLVDRRGVGRSHREAPEIDGVVHVPTELEVGSLVKVRVTGAAGPDLDAVPA